MKIAIIDDDKSFQDIFEKILTTAGHLVLKVTVIAHPIILDTDIANEVKAFGPDLVLIDEHMGKYVEGERLVKKLNLPKEKLIGTSLGSLKQEYCSKVFPWKNELLLGNQKSQDRIAEFLALLPMG